MFPEFQQLRQMAAELRRSQAPVPSEEVEARFLELAKGAAAISFDVFDTLTSRSVDHPVDVFHYLAFHPAFKKVNLGNAVIGLRVKAENVARHEGLQRHGSEEVLLVDIYRAFCQLAKLPPESGASLAEAEEEVDLSLSLVNEGGMRLFQLAAQSGKPMVILSDTYHRPEFILRLLQHLGYPVAASQLYCSSHYRKSKGRGDLFEVPLKALGIAPSSLFHIGDNQRSDSQIPAEQGILTLWHPFRVHLDHPRPFVTDVGALHSAVRSLAARSRLTLGGTASFWERIGFSALGPLFVGYAFWLRRQFEEKKIARAYFLLRDGEIVHRIYQAVVGEASPCPVQTLHSSRRAMIFPLFGQHAELVVPQLLAGIGKRPVGDYLARIGVDPRPFAAEFRAAGFELDTPVDARLEFSRMVNLFSRPPILKALAQAAGIERGLLVRYLVQEGAFAPDRIGLVDLGWNGTIQKAMHRLAAEHSPKTVYDGFYLATASTALSNPAPGLGFGSYIAHIGAPTELNQTLELCREFFEIFCSSSEGSTISFREEGGRIVPVLSERDISSRQVEILAKAHEGAVQFATQFKAIADRYGWKEIPPQIAIEEAARLLGSPTKEEALKIGQLAHGENWGTLRSHPLAAFRKDSASLQALWEDYRTSYWKKGMLNLPVPQAAMLKTFLWLLED